VDYSPFRNAINIALEQSSSSIPIISNLTATGDRAMPKRAVMFTYTSHYLSDFILPQQKAMENLGTTELPGTTLHYRLLGCEMPVLLQEERSQELIASS
jgi:hypothetical protein